uniref:arginine--tRNA ligase domain-containing protein n=1 Tax=Actinoplanes sp. RD1 TaxID=3064538 RepID=UPI0027427F67
MNLEALLSTRLTDVLEEPAVRRSPHADFQSGAALALARVRRKAPREIAADVVARADLAGLATAEVSGPGFVNFTISDAVLAAAATEVARDPRLGVPQTEQRETVLVDYSGPNAAKELTVGHLRPTVIGDALVRVLEWLGHDVVRANHLGDWGTSFGMLIEHVITSGDCSYQQARARFDTDAGFKRRAQQRVVLLQSGDAETLGWWERLVTESRRDFLTAYERLGVTLTDGDFAGESSYQPWLAEVVEELTAKGLLVESDGALCAFPLGRDSAPLIVRKSDGGYGYATTDLAALRYRTGHLGATRLLYVVGAPQRTHFAMVFAVARAAGWLPEGVHAEHVAFGSILGPDGKMFRSRSGDPVRLAGLLDEAEARA